MTYSASFLIEQRRKRWEESHDIEYDRQLREAIADRMLEDYALREEIRQNPEKLIELFFVVVDKDKKTVPFFFNEVQADFIERLNKAIDDYNKGLIPDISMLILKGRQQGFTTLITAYQLSCCILNRNFEGFTLADESSNTETIFQNKAKYPYAQLPESLKPTEKFNNKRQLLFEKLNSSWSVDTATKTVGRSRTINFFHGSECAFWRDGMAAVQSALGEALTKNCIKIYESTANGFNDFEEMWDSGVHINCFYEWWRTPEYRISFYSDEQKQEFIHRIYSEKGWLGERLRWLYDKGLDLEQIYWYSNKYDKLLDKELIKQEYPCTPEEAFLLSGKPVFDIAVIMRRLLEIPKPIFRGYFKYDYDGLRITNIRFVKDRGGHIRIYALPNQPEFTKYCIGGDTAGDGSDMFTAHVLDAKTGRQVAVMSHKFDPDQYAKQMYCLGKYYGNALLSIEANYDTFPIRELRRLGYDNQYVREDVDEYTNKKKKKFGFRTDKLTRPTIISTLIEIVRDHSDLINDEETLKELMRIVRNEEGRIEAPSGGHDDHMMGLAIAHEARGQVIFDTNVTYVSPQYQFSSERERDSDTRMDYGDEMVDI